MIQKHSFFNQPILYKGIRINCKSAYGYFYRNKTSEDQCFGFHEFVNEFVHKLNTYIQKEYETLILTDSFGLFFEVPLLILLLILTFAFKNNESVLISLTIAIVFSSLIFLYVKISSTLSLNRKIRDFLAENKPTLNEIGLSGSLFRARCCDIAPEIFLNLLPDSLNLEMNDSVNMNQNRSRLGAGEKDHEASGLMHEQKNNEDDAPIHLDIKSPEYSVEIEN